MAYLVRVQVPDRPGSLGSLAVALGSIGADIESLEVIERGEGYAIDDIVINLSAGRLPDSIISAAEHLPEVSVDSIRPYSGSLEIHRELEFIHKVSSAKEHGWDTLVKNAPHILRVNWVTILAKESGNHAKQLYASPGAPENPPNTIAPWPNSKPVILDTDAPWVPHTVREFDTALAAVTLPHHNKYLLIGRTGGPIYLPAELSRIGYLAGILSAVLPELD